MRLLAIETATEACSVALLIDGELRERFELAPRRHAELALPFAQSLLDEAGIAKSQLDAIAVGRGPGAFTGVRLAIALAQGLALALDRPVVPVSTLAALALPAVVGAPLGATEDTVARKRAPTQIGILALIDARMGEVYAGSFASDVDGLVTAVDAEQLSKPDALALPLRERWIVVGSGWASYESVLGASLSVRPISADGCALPRASAVARLAAREFSAGRVVDAAHAQPVYLRDRVALTIAEQRGR
jgi:tRNA threonylcarbamoyladenosine biosynthesis protein TsaB